MVTASLVLHGTLIVAMLLAPRGLLMRGADAPRAVMTISLGGGGEGPQNGGMTSIGGRPVQVVTPPEETPVREAVRPPAAKAPEMTVAKPNAKPVKAPPAPVVRQAPDEARGRTPTKGKEVQTGSAVAETAARGQGFGLSTGGGAGYPGNNPTPSTGAGGGGGGGGSSAAVAWASGDCSGSPCHADHVALSWRAAFTAAHSPVATTARKLPWRTT